MTISTNFGSLLSPPYSGQLLDAMEMSAILTGASWALAMSLGILLASIRATEHWLAERFVGAWVAYHQNVPMLAHLFVWYFGISTILPRALQGWINDHDGELILASVAIGLCLSAYFAEDLRSGLRAVSRGQHEAGRSLGLSFVKSMRYVILPQAFRAAIPPFINHTVVLFKSTSLAMAIGAAEMTYVVQEIENKTFRSFEVYTVATAFYLVVSLGLMGLGAVVARRVSLEAR